MNHDRAGRPAAVQHVTEFILLRVEHVYRRRRWRYRTMRRRTIYFFFFDIPKNLVVICIPLLWPSRRLRTRRRRAAAADDDEDFFVSPRLQHTLPHTIFTVVVADTRAKTARHACHCLGEGTTDAKGVILLSYTKSPRRV